MVGPLLETKLHAPPSSTTRIERPRLSARLSGGGDAAVMVVSAPAGFGKSTAVAEWLASRHDRSIVGRVGVARRR